MKPKSPIEAVSFSDGIVNLYRKGNDNLIDESSMRMFYFSEQGFSYKRLFEAEQEQQSFERIIRIPCPGKETISQGTIAEIDSKKYVVLSCQKIVQTAPECLSLVLGNWSMNF